MEQIKEVTIVGLPYYEYDKAKVKVGDKLYLAHDVNNKHSKTAVVVVKPSDNPGRIPYKIGYITGRESERVLETVKLASLKFTTYEVVQVEVIVTHIGTSCIIAKLGMKELKTLKEFEEQAYNTKYPTSNKQSTDSHTKKESNTMEKIVTKNVDLAKQAAVLEAGRIANNAATKMIASKAPLMVKGYVETPFGKLVIANAAAMAVEKLRPNDRRLVNLANAMITEAYQEVYQHFDIEKMLNGMLENETVKAALSKLNDAEQA